MENIPRVDKYFFTSNFVRFRYKNAKKKLKNYSRFMIFYDNKCMPMAIFS